MSYPCPSCGFEVFGEPSGCYEICPVCGWEDDPVQLRFPTRRGGANGGSLHDYQQQILRDLPPGVVDHDGWHRCADWRPLTQDEIAGGGGTPLTGKGYFDAVIALDEAAGAESPYYWRRRP